MKTFEIIKSLMKEHGIKKQTDLARIIHKKEKIETKERVNMSGYLTGMVKFPDFALLALSEHFNVTLDYLQGVSKELPIKSVPIIGTASCGACDISVLQDLSMTALIAQKDWHKELYAVIANGDSMATEIYDGDIVVIDPLKDLQDGDMVYYKLDDECAIKVYLKDLDNNMYQFIPFNSSDCFKTRTIRFDDEDIRERLIIHKVVKVISDKKNNRAARLKMIGR